MANRSHGSGERGESQRPLASVPIEVSSSNPRAPIKVRAQLRPNVPDPSQPVDFRDIADDVDAFTGASYPYDGPLECP